MVPVQQPQKLRKAADPFARLGNWIGGQHAHRAAQGPHRFSGRGVSIQLLTGIFPNWKPNAAAIHGSPNAMHLLFILPRGLKKAEEKEAEEGVLC